MMPFQQLAPPLQYLLWGIPILFLIGSGAHFLFAWSGGSRLLAPFVPVNESIWEHEKLLLPMMLWYGSYALLHHDTLSLPQWSAAALTAQLTALLVMPCLYYLYTGALGVHLLWVDISLLAVSLLIGQLAGIRVLLRGGTLSVSVAAPAMLGILAVFWLFTYAPPHLPLFLDGPTGGYGIPS